MQTRTDLIEPEAAACVGMDPTFIMAYSCAVSLKRIADRLDGEGIKAVLNTLAQHPVNAYGEGFADAIQNGIERDKRGINSHDR